MRLWAHLVNMAHHVGTWSRAFLVVEPLLWDLVPMKTWVTTTMMSFHHLSQNAVSNHVEKMNKVTNTAATRAC